MKTKVLGLDLGVTSIGWGLLEKNDNGEFAKIIGAGSRIFEAAIEIDSKTGKSSTNAALRREKRQIRKMLARRRRRLSKLRHCLQRNNLLVPEENFAENINQLDAEIIKNLHRRNPATLPNDEVLVHVLPYYLRALGLDYNLERFELGRALYHLGQRRGFKSNRKIDKSDNDAGKVKDAIRDLNEDMQVKHARTLGEYFSQINPAENRIRERYTSRAMYEYEFNLICDRQSTLITPELRQELHHIIFFQRPLKSVSKLIGDCNFEPDKKRCSWSTFEAQEFRVLQNVNNLIIVSSDGDERKLTEAERQIVLDILNGENDVLDKNANLKYTSLRKILNLPKSSIFSIESGGEKMIKGNSLNAKFYRVLGEDYKKFTSAERNMLLTELKSYDNSAALAKKLMVNYHFTEAQAADLSEYVLPDGYCNLSKVAINKLLLEMRKNLTYGEAVNQVYPETFANSGVSLDELPPFSVVKELADIPNPGVKRVFSELHQIINAIIKKYGKPDFIRIELAKDLKNSEKERAELIKQNRERESFREKCREMIIADKSLGISRPKKDDILKVMLAEECKWCCPYTGKTIALASLLKDSEFDIEHIIPYSRSMDNSYGNKTLCYHAENRQVKKNYTPYEAYASTPEKYQQILLRVSKFNGPQRLVQAKLRRFKLENIGEMDGFAARELNDTRIASKYAMKYLSLLYGGVADANGVLRIQASSGKVSALMRNVLDFNDFLSENGNKNRGDHRHHAVDAIAIALSDAYIIKHVAEFFSDKDAMFKAQRFWDNMRDAVRMDAWDNFYKDIEAVVQNILVSHHIKHRVRGALHEDTIYSKEHIDKLASGKPANKYCRKPLAMLAEKDVENIVDAKIRQLVEARLDEIGIYNPAKAFKNPENLPYLTSKDGQKKIVIKKVKIKISLETLAVGKNDYERNVKLGNNHHMELVNIVDENGIVKRQDGYVVTMFEAYQRTRNHENVIKRNFPDLIEKGKTYKQVYLMSLFRGDIIFTREDKDNSEGYRVINCIAQSKKIIYINLCEARPQKEYKEAGKFYSAQPNTLLSKLKGKYLITPLGEERRNNA